MLYHPERDLVLLVYVDDVLADGMRDNVEWIFNLMEKRFDCRDSEYLTESTPLDYVGIEIEQSKTHIYMHMQKYIQSAVKIMQSKSPSNWKECKAKGVTPLPDQNIERDQPLLSPADTSYFLTGLGMVGWLSNTARPDVAYAHSRIGQHAATPTQEAKMAITQVFKYLEANDDYALAVKLHDEFEVKDLYVVKKDEAHWRFYTDADFAGNSEVLNKRRSQSGFVVTMDDTPVYWQSKVSSVAFAHEKMGEAHADMSSGASEVYAAGNAAQECLYFSYCVSEMGLGEVPLPMKLEMDNTAAEIFCNDTAFKTKLKHIDCRQQWVRALRDHSVLTPVHVASPENQADFFTKILPVNTFQGFRDRMMSTISSLK